MDSSALEKFWKDLLLFVQLCSPKSLYLILACIYTYILLHDWEGNTGEYSVRGWQYWPEHSEGQYRSRELNIPPYCPTQRSAVIDLLYDIHTVLLVVHAQGSSL